MINDENVVTDDATDGRRDTHLLTFNSLICLPRSSVYVHEVSR